MRLLTLSLLMASALMLTACGGKVIIDGIPEGTGGAGGTGSVGDAGGAGGTPSASSNSSIVSSTIASTIASSGTGGGCPMNVDIQAPCPTEGQVCPLPLSCCNGTATCKGSRWHFNSVKCQQPCTAQCGPDNFSCQANAVCVAYIAKSTTYACRAQPCMGPLTCSCAEPLCEEQVSMTCNNIQDGYKVLCDCKDPC